MPGNDLDNADAEGAYTQSPMMEHDTWIHLPPEAIPPEYQAKFKSIHNPVVPMTRALEGHPRAGKFWEEYCLAALQRGWETVEGWECLFFHRELQLFLSIYVDDFKMAGKAASIPKAWKSLTTGKNAMILQPRQRYGQYLGVTSSSIKPNL